MIDKKPYNGQPKHKVNIFLGYPLGQQCKIGNTSQLKCFSIINIPQPSWGFSQHTKRGPLVRGPL